MSNKKSINQ